jgi:hypothetical protein
MSVKMQFVTAVTFLAAWGFPALSPAQSDQVNGDGNMTTVNRTLDPFHSIYFTGSFDVVITQGSSPAVKIVGEDNIIPLIVTEVKGGSLEIRTKDHSNINSRKPITVYITASGLDQINSAGSGDLHSEGELKGNHMEVTLAGSGEMHLELQANDVEGKLQGSGDMKLDLQLTGDFHGDVAGSGNMETTGTADHATLDVAGSGDISAKNLRAKNWETNIVGSGDISR